MASLFRYSPAARVLAAAGSRSAMIRQSAASPLVSMVRPVLTARVAPRVGITAFHTTKKLQILPAGPQVIDGDVNEPTPVPPANPVHGSYHWSFERLFALSLVPLTMAPFVGGSLNPVMDSVFTLVVVLHSHIGFQSCIIDYFPRRTMPGLHKALRWFLTGTTTLVLYGFYEFETNDVGVTEAIKRIWKA